VKKQVKESAEALQKKLAERQKEAREQGLKEAEDIFKKLERSTRDLAKSDTDRKQALVNLNELAKDLEKRRQELASNEKLKQQLNQLKDMKQGPGDKLSQALKEGNLTQAAKEIEKLKEQIKMGQLSPDAQKKLAEQLSDLQQKLNQMAESNEKKMSELKQRIQQKRDAGKNAEADDLEKQLAAMQKQSQQMQQLQKLGEKMGQCAQCLQEGNTEQAKQAMDQLQADLKELQSQLDEMQMLDQAMDEIAMAKEMMNGGRMRGDRPGDGLGEGRGFGDRPEERTDVKFHDSSVKQKTGRGAAVVTGFAEGPNIKGQVEQQLKLEYEAAKSEQADPLAEQRLPRDYRDHAKKYFEALREGAK
jgi:DNA repair exonuclease SbcCD ATPase subunit